jgi:1,2-diacylglycerol 3-beta-glucosyltransferase
MLAYLPHLVRVVVVADRCADATAAVARDGGAECLERRDGPPGKGAAIAWAIDRLRESGAGFDALVVLDADTLVDPRLLQALDEGLRAGHDVQQAYNYLSNPWESAFTRVIAVTSILRNGLFYAGKERLGLAAMLTGTGMCFSRALLERRRWSAFSVGEDWEFSVALLLAGETIHFNRRARVLARESHDFQQASSQRMRWAGGRYAVASAGGRELLARGLRQRRLVLCDASLNVLAPTYSVQAVLSLLCLAASALVSGRPEWHFLLFAWALAQTGLLAAYFLLGVALTAAPLRALAGILLIPAFLPWRMAIEIRGMLGQGRKHWVRTSRAPASR